MQFIYISHYMHLILYSNSQTHKEEAYKTDLLSNHLKIDHFKLLHYCVFLQNYMLFKYEHCTHTPLEILE